jgi:amidophosphoribosyltransferase
MCGIIGVFPGSKNAQKKLILRIVMGLHALQHRGQDSCGISAFIDGIINTIKSDGTITESWKDDLFNALENGSLGVGHVRYPTKGKKSGTRKEMIQNAQPFQMYLKGIGQIALVHNGTVINTKKFRKKIEARGQVFRSDTDSEVIMRMLSLEKGPLVKRLKKVLKKLKGGATLILITRKELIGVINPSAYWPLEIGRRGKSFILASETSALETNNFKHVRTVQPGEIIRISKKGLKSYKIKSSVKPSRCIFEPIYVSRPDSKTFCKSVSAVRMAVGKDLANLYPIKGDIVCAMPDSGMAAAIGYSQESGIPLEQGILRNHYESGRAFQRPTTASRRLKTLMKLPLDRNIIEGKIIIVVDDSIVRGNTMHIMIKRLYEAGAKEVHVLIASSPVFNPCYFGIDTPTHKELFANKCKSVKAVEKKGVKKLGMASLHFIPLKKVYKALGVKCPGKNSGFCDACFTANYPMKIAA